MASLQDKDGNWIFITPIDGLELTKEINQEFVVNRVTFVSKEKLPRIRKRLKIPVPISELIKVNSKKDKWFEKHILKFFSTSKTYAVLPFKGKPKEKEKDCIRLIQDELNILALLQLGWSTRRFNSKIKIKTSDNGFTYRKIYINKQKKEFNFGFKTTSNPTSLVLNKKLFDFHKRFFFFDLLKIIRGETSVSKKWRTILHRATTLAGQSQNSDDIPSCFLWNVIVLEMLLIEPGENISDGLIKRSEYFLGWNEQWKTDNYESRIKDIYSKRCNFVHEGDIKYIQTKDLIFSDDLIFNILNNLVRCKDKIQDRNDIVRYCEKYEAEKVLNQESKYQFGKFEITRKHYNEEDFKSI